MENIIMKKITVFLMIMLVLCTLVSCSVGGVSGDGASGLSPLGTASENKGSKGKLPHIADYTGKDMTYTATVSDGVRSVTLDVKRTGKVTEATVTSPEEISGTGIICDAAGLRVRTPYADCKELTVSPDAAAGLAAVFDLMKTPLGRDSFTGSKCFSVTVDGLPVKLKVSGEGFPECAEFGEGYGTRYVNYTNVKLSDNGKK